MHPKDVEVLVIASAVIAIIWIISIFAVIIDRKAQQLAERERARHALDEMRLREYESNYPLPDFCTYDGEGDHDRRSSIERPAEAHIVNLWLRRRGM